jgi:hypothetical protein
MQMAVAGRADLYRVDGVDSVQWLRGRVSVEQAARGKARKGEIEMRLLRWLKSRRSNRGRCLWLYNEAVAKAKKHDRKGAIEDYTATTELREVPPDVQAMALYDRALLHAAATDSSKAIDDLNAVLAMAEPLAQVKTAAKQKLAIVERRRSKSEHS